MRCSYKDVINLKIFLRFAERSLECKTANNTILQEGSVIEVSECMSCVCDEGLLKCTNKECPVLTCNWMTKRPGECCPVCKSKYTT